MNQGNKKMNFHKIIPKIFMVVLWLTMTSVAHAAVYEYDELDRLIKVTYDSGQIVSYTYKVSAGKYLMIPRTRPSK